MSEKRERGGIRRLEREQRNETPTGLTLEILEQLKLSDEEIERERLAIRRRMAEETEEEAEVREEIEAEEEDEERRRIEEEEELG